MNTETSALAGIISLNGGKISGRTRLQKTVFLLDCVGAELNFPYFYHYFGPYSSQLARHCEDLCVDGFITVDAEQTSKGYFIETFKTTTNKPEGIGRLSGDAAERALSVINSYSDVVLELAATMVFLARYTSTSNVEEEVRIRKPRKADDTRITKAQQLIGALGLSTLLEKN